MRPRDRRLRFGDWELLCSAKDMGYGLTQVSRDAVREISQLQMNCLKMKLEGEMLTAGMSAHNISNADESKLYYDVSALKHMMDATQELATSIHQEWQREKLAAKFLLRTLEKRVESGIPAEKMEVRDNDGNVREVNTDISTIRDVAFHTYKVKKRVYCRAKDLMVACKETKVAVGNKMSLVVQLRKNRNKKARV